MTEETKATELTVEEPKVEEKPAVSKVDTIFAYLRRSPWTQQSLLKLLEGMVVAGVLLNVPTITWQEKREIYVKMEMAGRVTK